MGRRWPSSARRCRSVAHPGGANCIRSLGIRIIVWRPGCEPNEKWMCRGLRADETKHTGEFVERLVTDLLLADFRRGCLRWSWAAGHGAARKVLCTSDLTPRRSKSRRLRGEIDFGFS